jgi:hypothetical protein
MVTAEFLSLLQRGQRARRVVAAEAARSRARSAPFDGTQFAGVTAKSAGCWAALAASSRVGIVLVGAWHRRRFVVGHVRRADGIVRSVSQDVHGLKLAIPASTPAAKIASACRSFGARVERAAHAEDVWAFELVCCDYGGPRHIVHRYHHVALCGETGPWPEVPLEPEIACEIEVCGLCDAVSKEKPPYRARYHPLSYEPERLPPLS